MCSNPSVINVNTLADQNVQVGGIMVGIKNLGVAFDQTLSIQTKLFIVFEKQFFEITMSSLRKSAR